MCTAEVKLCINKRTAFQTILKAGSEIKKNLRNGFLQYIIVSRVSSVILSMCIHTTGEEACILLYTYLPTGAFSWRLEELA